MAFHFQKDTLMIQKFGKNILLLVLFLAPINLMAHSDASGLTHLHIGSEVSLTYLTLGALALAMTIGLFYMNPTKKRRNNAK